MARTARVQHADVEDVVVHAPPPDGRHAPGVVAADAGEHRPDAHPLAVQLDLDGLGFAQHTPGSDDPAEPLAQPVPVPLAPRDEVRVDAHRARVEDGDAGSARRQLGGGDAHPPTVAKGLDAAVHRVGTDRAGEMIERPARKHQERKVRLAGDRGKCRNRPIPAADADDGIIYDQATGNVWYDADGNGIQAAQLFAKLTAGALLAAGDFQIINSSVAAAPLADSKDLLSTTDTFAML